MTKVKANITINDYNISKKGILTNDILIVKENDTNLAFNYKNLVLTRRNCDYIITLDFKNKKIIYEIPEISQKFYHNFTILSLTNKAKQVMINYQIEKTLFSLKINYETIE